MLQKTVIRVYQKHRHKIGINHSQKSRQAVVDLPRSSATNDKNIDKIKKLMLDKHRESERVGHFGHETRRRAARLVPQELNFIQMIFESRSLLYSPH